MKRDQFAILWDKLKDNYSKAFDDDEHEARVFMDWFCTFETFDYETGEIAIKYYLDHLKVAWGRKWPERAVLYECFDREYKNRKFEVESEKTSQQLDMKFYSPPKEFWDKLRQKAQEAGIKRERDLVESLTTNKDRQTDRFKNSAPLTFTERIYLCPYDQMKLTEMENGIYNCVQCNTNFKK